MTRTVRRARRLLRHTLLLALPLTALCTLSGCTAQGSADAASGTTAATAVPTTPSPSATVQVGPPGVLFDSFRYTGPQDPALAAHGWEVRTDGGGPGIQDTWTTDGATFPETADAQGGRAMQVRLTTDGTPAGTRQTEVGRTRGEFVNGTLAARVFFTDRPAGNGRDGDHINECFYAISPGPSTPKYSELDFEYMPNGGWGAVGARLDTTSWRSSTAGDRDTRDTKRSLAGWHTMMITADNGKVTYSMDGTNLFTSDGKSYPREPLSIRFSSWLIDLPASVTGTRTWDTKVNWVYYQADKAVPLAEVKRAVDGLYSADIAFVDNIS
ncbi:glycoside hydrolase family 16 protein [Kitasatospora sp. NPDC088783]|uniref:glycoside hydrolase family 16 protein n=1 Tax=Kitasatospora sp. NPDC088783 TaxID=3364077 RepID=UPI003813F2F7